MKNMQRSDKYYQVPKHLNFKHLSNEEIGAIFRALNEYDGERAELETPMLNYVYDSICDHIDAENERYEEFCNTQKDKSQKRKACKKKDASDNNGHPQTTTDNHGHPQTTTDNHGYPQTSTDNNGHPRTSTDIHGYPTNQNKTNTNQINNTTTTATTTCEREAVIDELLNDQRWVQETSELVMLPPEEIREQTRKFLLQLNCTGDKTHNPQDIRRSLIGWLRKGKIIIDTEQHKNKNAKLHNNADRPANGASGRTRNGTGGSLDFIDQRCREIGL